MAEDFGAFITSRRRELELTLGDVASKLDVSPVTVSNWSNGQSAPDAAQLSALADLLDVPAAELAALSGGEISPVAGTAPAAVGTVDVEEQTEVPIPEPDVPSRTSKIDDELANMIDEAATEREALEVEVPAFVAAAAPTPTPAPARTQAPRRRPAAPAVAERPVTTLPLTYIEDPKQLMRYRIRWGLTVLSLVVMFLVLIWAAGGLISALSDIKEAVTPGGGS